MRWIVRIAFALVGLIVVAAAGGYIWLRGSLPQMSGTIAIPGLTAPVEIVRDREGVPHIAAASEADAYRALGFVHAQDRLWQMELQRRLGAGRTSELVGAATLPMDKTLRTLGIYRVAQENYADLDPASRALLDAYAEGVNAFLATRDPLTAPLPIEFQLLGVAPEPWRPADSLVWGKMMALSLSANWNAEVNRARLATKLSAAQIAELYPAYPPGLPTALIALGPVYRDLPLAFASIEATLADLVVKPDPANGSNNWVVAGSRSATGKPILANDPHLGLQVPSVWYFAHLRAPGLDAIGATLPGIPAIILGRNQRIAWAFTNTGPDTQDLFIEKIDPADPNRYLAPDGPRPFAVRNDTIKVKGGGDVELTIRSTRHGPVISDVNERTAKAASEGHVLALAWTALSPTDKTARAPHGMARAQNWTEFVAAIRDYETPMQNMLYADVDGRIGYYAPAKVPIRKAGNAIAGTAPVPGWDATYDWDGFVPFDELPHHVDPPAGMIATANNKIVDERYPHHITYDWEEPYRAQRIAEVLNGHRRHAVEDSVALQADVVSPLARELLPQLLRAKPAAPAAREALALMAGWDGRMDAGKPQPLIFAAWYRALEPLLYGDEAGALLFAETFERRPRFVANALARNPVWCDDVTTPAVEDCRSIVTRAFEQAVDGLSKRYGHNPKRWRWGLAHATHMKHQPFTRIPVLAGLFDLRIENGGGNYTVNRGGYSASDAAQPFAHIHGASLRAIYDLSDLDRSLYMHSSGQSGNRLSPLYGSFIERWRDVRFMPMTTARAAYAADALGTLTLTPAR